MSTIYVDIGGVTIAGRTGLDTETRMKHASIIRDADVSYVRESPDHYRLIATPVSRRFPGQNPPDRTDPVEFAVERVMLDGDDISPELGDTKEHEKVLLVVGIHPEDKCETAWIRRPGRRI